MIPANRAFFRILPRLNPLESRNWLYLASSAVITRFAVAGIRVWENQPEKNKNPEYNRVDKYSSLWERTFIEPIGTAGYMMTMHAGMDAMAHYFERNIKRPLFDTTKEKVKAFAGMTQEESIKVLEKANQAIKKIYGESPTGKGIIDRALFGPSPALRATRKNLLTQLEKTGVDIRNTAILDRIMGSMKKPGTLEHFITDVNLKCAKTIGVGILLGAVFGGVVIQWVNDRVFSPYMVPFINKILGISNKPQQFSYQNNPFASYDAYTLSSGSGGNLSEQERTFQV